MSDEKVELLSKNGRKIGKTGIIDYELLVHMRDVEQKTWGEIGDYFGVTAQAVSQAYHRISKDSITKVHTRGKDLKKQRVTISEVLIGLMRDASDILNDLRDRIERDKDNEEPLDKDRREERKLMLATMAEMRQQLGMYSDFQEKIFSIEANENFQRIVIDAIEEAEPAIAEKIKQQLKRRNPILGFIGENRRE